MEVTFDAVAGLWRLSYMRGFTTNHCHINKWQVCPAGLNSLFRCTFPEPKASEARAERAKFLSPQGDADVSWAWDRRHLAARRSTKKIAWIVSKSGVF